MKKKISKKDKITTEAYDYMIEMMRPDKYAIVTFLERGIVPLQLSNFLLTFKTLKAADKAAFKYEKLYRKDCRVISLDSVHE